jgi:hypothetical protein
MAMKGLTKCAVPDCNMPARGPNANLCHEHLLPGPVCHVRNHRGVHTMVVTARYAERGDECGIIFLNDWAVGAYFGGGPGFEAKLAEQGFTNVRLLETLEELELEREQAEAKEVGDWSGTWKTEYPWERSLDSRGRS